MSIKRSYGEVTNKLKNYFSFVYSLASMGLVLSFSLASIFGELRMKVGINNSAFFLLDIIFFAGSFIASVLISSNKAMKMNTSTLVGFLGFEALINGYFLHVIYIYGKYVNAGPIFLALGTTTITFISAAIFVYFSKVDFSFSSSESARSRFSKVLNILFLSILSLFLCKIGFSLFGKNNIVNGVDSIYLVLSLVLSLIFVIYSNGVIKRIYDVHENDSNSLTKLGVVASILVLNSFIALFMTLCRIFMKKNDK